MYQYSKFFCVNLCYIMLEIALICVSINRVSIQCTLKNFQDIPLVLVNHPQPCSMPQPLNCHVFQLPNNSKVVPKPLQDHNFLVKAPNGTSNYSIIILFLNKFQQTLIFSNWTCGKSEMPLPKIKTHEGSLYLLS